MVPQLDTTGVAFIQLSLLPARTWNTAAEEQESATTPAHRADISATDAHLEECIAACEQALGLKLPGGSSSEGHAPLQQSGCRMVVHNLFALEGFHIAEALGLPSLALSACLVPYGPPAGFETRFRWAFPELSHALHSPGEQHIRSPTIPHLMFHASILPS